MGLIKLPPSPTPPVPNIVFFSMNIFFFLQELLHLLLGWGGGGRWRRLRLPCPKSRFVRLIFCCFSFLSFVLFHVASVLFCFVLAVPQFKSPINQQEWCQKYRMALYHTRSCDSSMLVQFASPFMRKTENAYKVHGFYLCRRRSPMQSDRQMWWTTSKGVCSQGKDR